VLARAGYYVIESRDIVQKKVVTQEAWFVVVP